jgi:hypothetical protein
VCGKICTSVEVFNTNDVFEYCALEVKFDFVEWAAEGEKSVLNLSPSTSAAGPCAQGRNLAIITNRNPGELWKEKIKMCTPNVKYYYCCRTTITRPRGRRVRGRCTVLSSAGFCSVPVDRGAGGGGCRGQRIVAG